ncbi:EAL domain-containing protein [Psychromonas sp. 14N.309.X.WAT.B.A12]|uniref:sensor domain-containing protein n=1 Tax=Psychromonas sp. 14N.309.X.WAT.B.A12 TaxID=2998322 RepID=UPI0025AFA6AF|nr:EAL domain-containing protein [Psychromonas sp. 14N.309.X.WAT.B.A12]MDN2664717.1 EAL domain-containing protein [Psychromonas sp. 14N.309.X.WAT.B.A12]
MSSQVSKVLYIGNNVQLVKALLPINAASGAANLTHCHCVNGLEEMLQEQDFDYFICEVPISGVLKERIKQLYPVLECIYLSSQEEDNATSACFTDAKAKDCISDEIKSTLNCISIPIYYKSNDGFIIACNSYFSNIFGYSPDVLVGKELSTLLPDGTAAQLIKSDTADVKSNQPLMLECNIEECCGEKREFLLREEVDVGCNMRVGMLFDISEMNAVKATIEKERLMLRATADLSEDLIFFKDLDSRFIGCNKQFEKFVGCSEAEIIGKADDELFEINQARMCQAQDAQVMSNNETYANNEYLTYNNGEKHFIFMQKVPLRDKHGEVQGLFAIGRDITEQSIIEKQLRLANVVFENSRDGILVTDNTGVVITANDACFSVSGYSKEELIDVNITSFADGFDSCTLFDDIEVGIKKEGKWQGNVRFYTKMGYLGYFWLEVNEVKHGSDNMNNRVFVFTDLTQNKDYEAKIQYLSKHDSLTGLNNRIALFTHLEKAIARANHKQTAIGVLHIEIKGIKAVNERYGHNKGDVIFRGIAKRLKELASDKDIIARISDDQFALVIEELENEQVVALIARQITQQFSGTVTMEGIAVNLTTSIGISICPDDGSDVDSILSNAENAMYRSKNDKSSAYHFYTNELTINSTNQLALENELKVALNENQFDVYYQPQFDLNKRQIVAVECVLRWHHPEHGTLLPERFLMLAEQSGLMVELSMKMFTKAVEQAVKWHHAGINFGRIAFNISKAELSQLSLIASIQKIFLDTGAKANWFEFEIDEALFSNDLYTVQENLLNLSRLGISFTVDGFGAERSVLYCIDKLNIDKFKISKHFIQGVPGYLAGEAMLKSVFVLANSLGIDVVGDTIDNDPREQLINDHQFIADKNQPTKEAMSASEATFYLRCHKRK